MHELAAPAFGAPVSSGTAVVAWHVAAWSCGGPASTSAEAAMSAADGPSSGGRLRRAGPATLRAHLAKRGADVDALVVESRPRGARGLDAGATGGGGGTAPPFDMVIGSRVPS